MSEDLENKEIIFPEQDSDTKNFDNNDSESSVDTNILRPKSFDEYVGQEKIIQSLSIATQASKKEMSLLIMYFFMVRQA